MVLLFDINDSPQLFQYSPNEYLQYFIDLFNISNIANNEDSGLIPCLYTYHQKLATVE